jgi:type II secretory pathway component PulJ
MLNLKHSKKSFTIIELLTAIAVFTFIIIATLGIYTITIQRHFQAQKIQTVEEELHYAIEVMARDIKGGYLMGSKDTNGDSKIDKLYIANQNKLTQDDDYNKCLNNLYDYCLTYRIDTSNSATNGIWVKYGSADSQEVRLTSSKIKLTNGSFTIFAQGNPNLPKDSPLTMIDITALFSSDKEEVSKISLHTSVTQEELTNYYQGNL